MGSLTSRRAMLSCIAASPALGLPALAAETHPDAALLALGSELDVIEKMRRTVFRELMDAEDRTINADHPDALIATNFDILDGFPVPAWEHDIRGKTWSPLQIEEIRSAPPHTAYFAPGGRKVCEVAARRRAEILAAYDAYSAERGAANDASGLTEVAKRYNGVREVRDDLARRIIATPATTLEGLAVKARLRMALDGQEIKIVPNEVSVANVARSILADLLAPGAPA